MMMIVLAYQSMMLWQVGMFLLSMTLEVWEQLQPRQPFLDRSGLVHLVQSDIFVDITFEWNEHDTSGCSFESVGYVEVYHRVIR
jgi:hypothetical protein